MGLIQDVAGGYNKFKQIKNLGQTAGEVKKPEGNDQVITDSTTIDPKSIVNDFKEVAVDKIDQLKSFVKDNPLFATFVEGLVAGLAVGTMEKTAEKKAKLNGELATYMDDLKTNMEKTYKACGKQRSRTKFKDTVAEAFGIASGLSWASFPFVAVGYGVTLLGALMAGSSGVAKATLYTAAGQVAFTGLSFLTSLLLGGGSREDGKEIATQAPSIKTKGERFLPCDEYTFLTVPPGTNKLLYCKVQKDEDSGEVYPELIEMQKLPDVPVSLGRGYDRAFHNDEYRAPDGGIQYDNPDLTSEISLYYLSNAHHDSVSVRTTDHKKVIEEKKALEQKKLDESKARIKKGWDNFSEKMKEE